jgi:hypothetical protein
MRSCRSPEFSPALLKAPASTRLPQLRGRHHSMTNLQPPQLRNSLFCRDEQRFLSEKSMRNAYLWEPCRPPLPGSCFPLMTKITGSTVRDRLRALLTVSPPITLTASTFIIVNALGRRDCDIMFLSRYFQVAAHHNLTSGAPLMPAKSHAGT